MNIYFSKIYKKKLGKLIKKNPGLKKDLIKQLSLFAKNSKHPSLKLHKLKGQRSVQFSIWIKGDLRALYIKDKQDIIFVDILNHDEY